MNWLEKTKDRLKALLTTDDKRNATVRNNAMASAVLKAVGLATSLLIVPVTLGYLDNEVYGVWLTMSSMLYWFGFFDVGLGNGMRNYLTEAISRGHNDEAQRIISTTFLLLSVVAAALCVVATVLLCLIDVGRLYNTLSLPSDHLRTVTLIAVVFTLVLFVVKNVGMVFVAMQRYALNDLLGVTGNVVALLIIYVLTKTTDGNLLYVVTAFTATPVMAFVAGALPLFAHHSELRPSLKNVDMSLARKVVGKGLGFFLIQITSCVVIFGCANLTSNSEVYVVGAIFVIASFATCYYFDTLKENKLWKECVTD